MTHRSNRDAYLGEMRSFACKPSVFFPKNQLEAFEDESAVVTCVYCLLGETIT